MEPGTGRRLTIQAWVIVEDEARPRPRHHHTIRVCACNEGILFVIDPDVPDMTVSVLAPRGGAAERFIAALMGERAQDRLAPTG